jgi:hypothetical protein
VLFCFVAEFGPRPQRRALAVGLGGVVNVGLDALWSDADDLGRLLFRRGPSN